MKNLWPESFKVPDIDPPKAIFQQQAKLLPNLTKGMVYAEVYEINFEQATYESIKNPFAFRFDLIAKFLRDYSYKILSFSHDVKLYPVKLHINSEIREELLIKDIIVEIKSPQELEELLGKILKSNNISQTIGAIVKLS